MSFLRAALKKKIEKQGNVRKEPETPKPTSKFLYITRFSFYKQLDFGQALELLMNSRLLRAKSCL